MKQKFLFIKMLWMVIRNKENGWVFFRMTEQQQKDFLNDVQDVDIRFRYVGMDKKVVEKIVNRLETFESKQNEQKNYYSYYSIYIRFYYKSDYFVYNY